MIAEGECVDDFACRRKVERQEWFTTGDAKMPIYVNA